MRATVYAEPSATYRSPCVTGDGFRPRRRRARDSQTVHATPTVQSPPFRDTATGYRPDIDGLRAIAVLLVVVFHAFPNAIPGWFVGVDVFFVISCYLITGIIVRAHEEGRFSSRMFYVRRVRRIFPALVLVLAGSMAIGWLVLTLWVWPLTMILLVRRRRLLIPVIVIAIAASFAFGLHLLRSDVTGAYYLPFGRAWQLGIGALLAATRPAWELSTHRVIVACRGVAAYLGVTLIGIAALLLDNTSSFHGWAALMLTVGAALVISSRPNAMSRLLALRLTVAVGLVSYPLYRWHWPLLVFAFIHNNGPERARACRPCRCCRRPRGWYVSSDRAAAEATRRRRFRSVLARSDAPRRRIRRVHRCGRRVCLERGSRHSTRSRVFDLRARDQSASRVLLADLRPAVLRLRPFMLDAQWIVRGAGVG